MDKTLAWSCLLVALVSLVLFTIPPWEGGSNEEDLQCSELVEEDQDQGKQEVSDRGVIPNLPQGAEGLGTCHWQEIFHIRPYHPSPPFTPRSNPQLLGVSGRSCASHLLL